MTTGSTGFAVVEAEVDAAYFALGRSASDADELEEDIDDALDRDKREVVRCLGRSD